MLEAFEIEMSNRVKNSLLLGQFRDSMKRSSRARAAGAYPSAM